MRGCCSAVVSTGSKNRSTAAETETALRLVDRHELGDDSHAEVVATEVAFWPDMIREKTAFPDAYLPTDRSNSSSSRSCDLNVGSNSGGCGGSRLARIGGSWADRSIDSSADSWRENEEEDTTYYSSNHTRSTISRGTGAGRGRRNHCHDKTFRLSRHVRLSLRESVYLVAVIFIALTSTGGPRSTVSAAAAVLGGRIGAAGVEEELPSGKI